jgi:hypothetical protein
MAIADTPFNSMPDLSADLLQGASDGVYGSLFTNYPGLSLDSTVANFAVNPILVPANQIPNPFNLADVHIPGTSFDPSLVYVQLSNSTTDFTFSGFINAATVVPEPSTFLPVAIAVCMAFAGRYRFRGKPGNSHHVSLR